MFHDAAPAHAHQRRHAPPPPRSGTNSGAPLRLPIRLQPRPPPAAAPPAATRWRRTPERCECARRNPIFKAPPFNNSTKPNQQNAHTIQPPVPARYTPTTAVGSHGSVAAAAVAVATAISSSSNSTRRPRTSGPSRCTSRSGAPSSARAASSTSAPTSRRPTRGGGGPCRSAAVRAFVPGLSCLVCEFGESADSTRLAHT